MKRFPRWCWNWLGSTLRLTLARRIAFTVVLVLGAAIVLGDDPTGGVDGPNAAGIVAPFVLIGLLCVAGADALFRFARSNFREKPRLALPTAGRDAEAVRTSRLSARTPKGCAAPNVRSLKGLRAHERF